MEVCGTIPEVEVCGSLTEVEVYGSGSLILEQKTGQTIKMLKEKYTSAVAIQMTNNNTSSPVILGGHDLLQAVR